MTVCFFGHKDTPESIRSALEREIEGLIECGADCFLVGNQGRFDGMVLGCLRKITAKHPGVNYKVVLAYVPRSGDKSLRPDETMLPEGLEAIHPRFAIDCRNRWMAEEADAAVVYVAHSWGGAAKYAGWMERKGKTVRNLCREWGTGHAGQSG